MMTIACFFDEIGIEECGELPNMKSLVEGLSVCGPFDNMREGESKDVMVNKQHIGRLVTLV